MVFVKVKRFSCPLKLFEAIEAFTFLDGFFPANANIMAKDSQLQITYDNIEGYG